MEPSSSWQVRHLFRCWVPSNSSSPYHVETANPQNNPLDLASGSSSHGLPPWILASYCSMSCMLPSGSCLHSEYSFPSLIVVILRLAMMELYGCMLDFHTRTSNSPSHFTTPEIISFIAISKTSYWFTVPDKIKLVCTKQRNIYLYIFPDVC